MCVAGFFWPAQIKMAAGEHSSCKAWCWLLPCCWPRSSALSWQKSFSLHDPLVLLSSCSGWTRRLCQYSAESLALHWNCPTLHTGFCLPGCQLPVAVGARIGRKGWPCPRMCLPLQVSSSLGSQSWLCCAEAVLTVHGSLHSCGCIPSIVQVLPCAAPGPSGQKWGGWACEIALRKSSARS